jgi:hypothetical protein
MTPTEQLRRRAHAAEVENLLEELDDARRRVLRSKANGVRGAGLRELKSELAAVQQRLLSRFD